MISNSVRRLSHCYSNSSAASAFQLDEHRSQTLDKRWPHLAQLPFHLLG